MHFNVTQMKSYAAHLHDGEISGENNVETRRTANISDCVKYQWIFMKKHR